MQNHQQNQTTKHGCFEGKAKYKSAKPNKEDSDNGQKHRHASDSENHFDGQQFPSFLQLSNNDSPNQIGQQSNAKRGQES